VILTTRTRFPKAKVRTSPGPTMRAGFSVRTPFTRTPPSTTILAAKLRDLKKRACHSHLSIRIVGRGTSVTP
jgi:hypothetical protein